MHPLTLESPEESEIFKRGAQRSQTRKAFADDSLSKTLTTADDTGRMQQMFLSSVDENSGSLRALQKLPDTVWIHDTLLQSHHICHPEELNFRNSIFGGFLLRQGMLFSFSSFFILHKKFNILEASEVFGFNYILSNIIEICKNV